MWLIGESVTWRGRGLHPDLNALSEPEIVVVLQTTSDFFIDSPTKRTRFSAIRLSGCAPRDASELLV
jgi:hypothetical protein